MAVGVSAGAGSAVTYLVTRSDHEALPTPSASPTQSVPPAPQFNATQVAEAKQHLCQVFDGSVGHTGQGAFREEGKVNMPVTLQSVTSAMAVQNALSASVPADVSAAAHRYIDTILDVTTATMAGKPTSEVARLTNVSNEATDGLADACGLPK